MFTGFVAIFIFPTVKDGIITVYNKSNKFAKNIVKSTKPYNTY